MVSTKAHWKFDLSRLLAMFALLKLVAMLLMMMLIAMTMMMLMLMPHRRRYTHSRHSRHVST